MTASISIRIPSHVSTFHWLNQRGRRTRRTHEPMHNQHLMVAQPRKHISLAQSTRSLINSTNEPMRNQHQMTASISIRSPSHAHIPNHQRQPTFDARTTAHLEQATCVTSSRFQPTTTHTICSTEANAMISTNTQSTTKIIPLRFFLPNNRETFNGYKVLPP